MPRSFASDNDSTPSSERSDKEVPCSEQYKFEKPQEEEEREAEESEAEKGRREAQSLLSHFDGQSMREATLEELQAFSELQSEKPVEPGTKAWGLLQDFKQGKVMCAESRRSLGKEEPQTTIYRVEGSQKDSVPGSSRMEEGTEKAPKSVDHLWLIMQHRKDGTPKKSD